MDDEKLRELAKTNLPPESLYVGDFAEPVEINIDRLKARIALREELEDLEDWARQGKQIRALAEQMISQHYGERCPDYEPLCWICRKYKNLDDLLDYEDKVVEEIQQQAVLVEEVVKGLKSNLEWELHDLDNYEERSGDDVNATKIQKKRATRNLIARVRAEWGTE